MTRATRKGKGEAGHGLVPMLAYLRQSDSGGKAEDDPSARSLDEQRQAIAGYAEAYGLEIVGEVAERDVSGGRAASSRGLGELLDRVEHGEARGVIAYDVSRLGRDLSDFLATVERMDAVGAGIVAIRERVDTTNADDSQARFFLHLMAALAEMERGRFRERWARTVREAVTDGVMPSRTAVGYMRESVSRTTGRPAGRLVPDPKVAPTVARIFAMRARGASLRECADELEAATGKGWSTSTLTSLFRSPTYLGRIVIGRGEGAVVNEDAHEAIVDRRTWMLAQRAGEAPRHDGSLASQGILAGLVTCAGCGHVMTVTASGRPGERVASYSCRGITASGGRCPATASGLVSKVDALVLPGIESRAGRVDLEAALSEFGDAQAAYAAASSEFDSFLAGASIEAMGADVYNAEVARRRVALLDATEAYRVALDAQERLAESTTSGLEGMRELARRTIESVTLAKSTRGKWQPMDERLEIQWRA